MVLWKQAPVKFEVREAHDPEYRLHFYGRLNPDLAEAVDEVELTLGEREVENLLYNHLLDEDSNKKREQQRKKKTKVKEAAVAAATGAG